MQINLVIVPPMRETLISRGLVIFVIRMNLEESRKSPYLPNFKSTPARTIDPATGASTWALGSHRCVRYKGVFTRKAAIVISHQRERVFVCGRRVHLGRIIERWQEYLNIKVSERRRGREAVTVYMIKYIPACSRSGW